MAIRFLLSLALLVALATAAPYYSSEALANQITDLPGVPAGTNFKMFSGHIQVAAGRALFYWFVESQSSPEHDPLVLWTNGGPGCSGLAGFMTEQGPFRPTADGKLDANPHSWNKIANMIFIEQPAGVGFSTVSGAMNYTDAQAAADNAAFLRGFLQTYSFYNSSALYLTSESYGGHYLPTLAQEIVKERGSCVSDADCPGSYCLDDPSKTAPFHCHSGASGWSPNFKGFMVGNPLTYMPYRDYGMYGTFAGHNLLPKPEWDSYLKAGCREDDSSDTCAALMQKFDTLTAGMDPYALDFPVCTDSAASAGRHERHTLAKAMGKLGSYFPETYTPCDTAWGTKYLNTAAVQKALGVASLNVTWAECSDPVGSQYSQTDVKLAMMPVYKWLIKNAPELSILVMSGDDDSVCATLGTQQWVWDMGFPVADEWAPWKMDGQVSGFRVSFGKKGSPAFSLVTVHGAGHMVPATRPAQGLEVFKNYLSGKW
jgi:cathepsin A (carboxypeptidase C)/serine carboxypeptidase-like clade 2